ncbi:uncharacterized protein SAPINGB_P006157 [Magnusiomyces paraingens]|uniref:Uncharacterized protein n=1 Tax=Magnusiomyces paraingens TaxID=2606893 RepID=A0A5E8C5I8_9ASCO|nr:uncharacterized protein SAPINGB_P006157 [Saprochaete ingens]VVT58340.1 unnamed protein product [Saprochaete ingens]
MISKQQIRVFARKFTSSAAACGMKQPGKPVLASKDVVKGMDAPTKQEMWGLLSEIFAQTRNTPEVLARYHRRARELHAKKIAESKARGSDRVDSTKLGNNSGLYVTNERTTGFSLYQDLLKDEETEESKVKEKEEEEEEEARSAKAAGFSKNKLLLSLLDSPLKTSNTLFWPCGTLSFLPSDFKRILPGPIHSGSDSGSGFISENNGPQELTAEELAQARDFTVVRSRDPASLVRWIGYYLEFPTREAAVAYYWATLGAELCGIRVNFRFVDPSQASIHPPALSAIPGVSRRMCALVAGLPPRYSPHTMARILWDYDLLPSAQDAVVKLSGDEAHCSESSWLVRFTNEDEPRRLVRAYNNRYWPNTTMVPKIEVLD